jgi:hypothetical protein
MFFAVIFETDYVTRILFEGTKFECIAFMEENSVLCDECTFIQEMEYA